MGVVLQLILQLLPMKTCEFIKRYRNYKKNQSCKNLLNTRKNEDIRSYENMIKVLFVCHGSILKSPEKACKINDFTKRKGTYYTTTIPFLKEP